MDEENEILESFECSVAEITSDAVAGMVPLPAELVAEVTQGDDDPRFATIVIESGWSKSRRLWPPEIFENVAEQINNDADEPIVGYVGHITPDDDPYAFPDINFRWLRARVTRSGDKAKLAVKGYVLPGTKGREYLQKRLARTFSWAGRAAEIPYERGVKVNQFQIKSIDLARPRSAGMSARLVGALTSEMEEGGNSVKPEEIAALQENELRAHNAGLVTAIEENARKPLETKVTEMEKETKKVEPVLSLLPQLRSLLGLKDDADEISVVQSTIDKLKAEGKSLRENILDKVLEKRLKGGSEADRALVRRVLVGEMESRDVKLTGNSEDDMKAVSEMVTQIIDGDNDLKTRVSEMETTAPDLPATQNSSTGAPTEWKPGMSTANVRVKQRV
jgi:hypothetical protein